MSFIVFTPLLSSLAGFQEGTKIKEYVQKLFYTQIDFFYILNFSSWLSKHGYYKNFEIQINIKKMK